MHNLDTFPAGFSQTMTFQVLIHLIHTAHQNVGGK